MSNTEQTSLAKSDKITLLIVDDEASILKSLKRVFHGLNYRLVLADSAQKALDFMRSNAAHVIISDMKMPDINGPQFLSRVAKDFPHTYRIVLSGYADTESTLSAINDGKIHRYLQKPWDNDVIIQAVDEGARKYKLEVENKQLLATTALHNKQLKELNATLEQKVEFRTVQIRGALNKAEKSVVAIKKALYNTLSINPNLDGAFSKAVSKLNDQLASQLNIERQMIADIRYAGLICELGATGLPLTLLKTSFNSLSDTQKTLFYKQIDYAELIMMPAPELKNVSNILISQYEYVNGKGHKQHLTEEKIPIGARILAVSRDYYRYQLGKLDAEKHNKAVSLKKIKQFSGVQYDAKVVLALEKIVNAELKSIDAHDIGIVSDLLKPGMVLKEALFNNNDILVLPEGHTFDDASINRLRGLEQRFNMNFSILVD